MRTFFVPQESGDHYFYLCKSSFVIYIFCPTLDNFETDGYATRKPPSRQLRIEPSLDNFILICFCPTIFYFETDGHATCKDNFQVVFRKV